MSDDPLAEALLRANLMSPAQLKTAVEFQKSLGGDLRNIVVKLGYVKESDLVNLVAQEENVTASSTDINEEVIDFEALRQLPRALLEKHQVIPLRSDGSSIVLAMADPNDLRAIEEIQFLVNRAVEPAVATKASIRRALNQLHELVKKHNEGKAPKTQIPADRLKAIRELPLDRLVRAYVITQIEAGRLSVDDLLSRASRL